MSKRVIVAMSGGVDSSVAAALLKAQGYDVIGITLRIWEEPLRQKDSVELRVRSQSCCGAEPAIADARRVAQKIGIPHYTLDFRKEFERAVVSDFIREYEQGRTPNPCIRCNRFIKFQILLNRCQEFNADFLATGHYAKIERYGDRWVLKKARDEKKDQSYFLYPMTQAQLAKTLMPLGNLTKAEVRKIAQELGLVVAHKPESQEICFIPDDDYPKFLKHYIPDAGEPGPILNKQGEVIGKHKGLLNYTIGQRKRIGIPFRERLYVIGIDRKRNALIVGTAEDVYGSELFAKDLNFIAIDQLDAPRRVQAKIRSVFKPAWAEIKSCNGKVYLHFDEPQWAITPGQAVVFYDGEIVLGGGTIC
ncbi:MAG: tRNA 2-thiouridine(34) synthase MnmA [candidate division WOR-3 bacterium]